jgi:TonB-linked SusC/RagA family outer membrane protein
MRNLFYHVTTFVILIAFPFNLHAQNFIVEGTVTDSRNEALTGVSVSIKGTNRGTVTDINGHFLLEASPQDVLTFSYLGLKTTEVSVKSSRTIRITLEEDENLLEEVVAIGYGTVMRKDVTTAITGVSTKDLDKRPVITADQAIQGKAAGVSVIKPNGLPGEKMVIRVRGTTSMNSSNQPLYVVDGVTVDDISFLSANDIAGMQILKDASSAAIYGSRAANGVILITTKNGSAEKSNISFNSYIGFTQLANKVKSLNVDQYRELMEDMGSTIVIPSDAIDRTDWYKETFQTALTQNYQLSVAGGNEKTKYYFSGGYTTEDGIIKVAFFDRYNFRSNVDTQIRPWLNIGANISYADYSSNGIISGQGANRAGVVLSVINTPTYAPVWDVDNQGQYFTKFYGGVNITTPAENMARSENNKDHYNRLLATGKAEISFTPDLKFKSTTTVDRHYNNTTTFLDPAKTAWGRSQYGEASDNRSLSTVMIYDNILTFNKQLGSHHMDVMAGTSSTVSDWSRSYQTVSHFRDGTIQTLNAGNKVNMGNGTTASQWAILSYIGRAAYNYQSKYLLTVNMRIDGSSKLHPDHRWGYFPSTSAAWRISSENFMSDISWIDDLKIRGGWGQTGNQAGLGDYTYYALAGINRVDWTQPENANAVPTFSQSVLRNTELTWETTTQTNFGIDFTAFNSRLTLALDYYYKLTTDMLMWVNLPAGSAAAGQIVRNEGEMTNKGFEFSVNTRNLTGALKWDTDFNISFNRNKLTKLALTQVYSDVVAGDYLKEYIVRNEPGRPLGGFYGYWSDGVDPETGELKYRDITGEGEVNVSDRDFIGDPNPKFTFGMTNSFSYKGINLSILLQGSYGNDIFNASRIETEGMYDGKNQSVRVLDRWRRPGMETQIPKAGYDMKISSYFVEDGSFLRVKNIILSYDVSAKFMKKWGIGRIQPYLSVTNLFTLTRYTGFDPEVNQWGNSGSVQGIDWGTYPQTKSLTVGLNVEF